MATTLGNGPPYTDLLLWQKVQATTQAGLRDAVEKALGLHTQLQVWQVQLVQTLPKAVQGMADVSTGAGDYQTDITLTVVADFTD